jgi:hypothetical protein
MPFWIALEAGVEFLDELSAVLALLQCTIKDGHFGT